MQIATITAKDRRRSHRRAAPVQPPLQPPQAPPPLSDPTNARIQALPLEQLEAQTAVAGLQRSADRKAPLRTVSRSTSTAISLR
jgi:hypothetical protein